jgi:ubiquinone/menaquinone biosynthesis C-methylase UbiE
MAGTRFIGNVDSHTNDVVAGWIVDPAEPTRTYDVELMVDGARRSRVRAGFPRPDVKAQGLGSGYNGFYFSLPPADREGKSRIEIREAVSQRPVARPMTFRRTPSRRCAGLSRDEAVAMFNKPLLAIGRDGFSVRENVITLKGIYLPPGGDPFAYDVVADEGVSFELRRPQHDKGPLEYYWFWPNAEWGAWRIDIDLARTRHQASSYRFAFCPRGHNSPEKQEVLYVPKDLSLWQNLPDGEAMNRVQLADYAEVSPLRAATHCRAITDLAQRYLGPLEGLRALEWGCGWGRLTRTLAAAGTFQEIWGIDIDHDNLEWAQANIPAARFVHVPLSPPTTLPDDYFDLVYAVSVMTHLTRQAQAEWLDEIRRVLKPGGLAILTFHGTTAAAFASAYLSEGCMQNFKTKGFDDGMACDHLDSIIGAGYYRNTFQTQADVRANWGQHLKVIETRETAVGLQDAAVLIKA